jgi:hypothetical protein
MATKFDENKKRYAPSGYEGQNYTEDYTIPSCGLEDLDKAVFNLFDKQIPLYYDLNGETKKVPVIFATGERFALLRRKQPIVDKKGALILPLVSITRSNIENIPQKGISNNQMFPHIVKKKLSKKDLIYRQLENKEKFSNVETNPKVDEDAEFSLEYGFRDNIIETIEIPPIKYFGSSYEVTIWSSFTQQMNKILETIISAYTLNPGQQFRIESDKGYWFPAFIEQSFSQDSNYADFTDAERYIKFTATLSATGYIIAPNIEGGKTSLRSSISAPKVSFEMIDDYTDINPQEIGINDISPESHLFDDLRTDSDFIPSQMIGINPLDNLEEINKYDKSGAYGNFIDETQTYNDMVAKKGTDHTTKRKTFVKNEKGELIPVMSSSSNSQGETVYDAKSGKILNNNFFNK